MAIHCGHNHFFIPYQCASKLQDIPITGGVASHHHSHHHQAVVAAAAAAAFSRMPNFRLVEFFLNNFNSTRAYRSCRQCLMAYFRVLSALMTSSAADLVIKPNEEGQFFFSVCLFSVLERCFSYNFQIKVVGYRLFLFNFQISLYSFYMFYSRAFLQFLSV